MDKLNGQCDALRMKVNNLEMIMPSLDDGSVIKAVAEPLEQNLNDLKENS